MSSWLVMSIIIFVTIVVLALFFVIKNKNSGEKIETDYRTLFIIGVTWIPIGIATDNPGFWAVGIAFLIAGLVNKDKWKEQEKWSELPPEKRRVKMIVIIGITVLFLVGLVAYLLAK
jgi:heme/copper-type cytochrome/quinol oxidase subunit 2